MSKLVHLFGRFRTAVTGREEQFLPPRLSACFRFGQGTFAETQGNGRDAPIPDLPAFPPLPQKRSHVTAKASSAVAP
jgi:hypothetical protein